MHRQIHADHLRNPRGERSRRIDDLLGLDPGGFVIRSDVEHEATPIFDFNPIPPSRRGSNRGHVRDAGAPGGNRWRSTSVHPVHPVHPVLGYHRAAMPRLAANLSYLFTERPFLDRFEAAARWGFRAVEHQFPYTEASECAIRERLRAHDLRAVLFNLPPGEEGERGLGGLPGREAEFREGLDLALRYCRATGCPRLHAMWGVPDEATSLAQSRATFVANLREAAPRAAEAGVTLLVEPLNPRDNPGYPLNRQADAHALVAEVGAANVKVQLDLYHCQIVEGDVAPKLDRWVGGPDSNVGHIQIAGPPTGSSPMPASSTTSGCSRASTPWDTRVGSAASIGRRRGPRPVWAGRAGGGSAAPTPES